MSREDKLYTAFRETLGSKPKLIPFNSKLPVTKIDLDYYVSIFQYTDAHKKIYEHKGTLAGIKDTTTDSLYFDFDSKDNLEAARQDSIELLNRLVDQGVDPDSTLVSFTGSKGFSVEVKLDRRITNKEFKAAVGMLAGDLKTFDHVVSDPNRIVRVDNTKHPKTGNFKIPLVAQELDELSIDKILELAKTQRPRQNTATPVTLNEVYFYVKPDNKTKPVESGSLKEAMNNKPRHWKDYKWSLAQGFFEPGERHNALMVVAATCRGLGYDKHTAYYICKSALKKQAAITGEEEFDKSELFENIIENSVYSDNWEGGQYSPKTNPWLAKYCERMGFKTDEVDEIEAPAITLGDMSGDFLRLVLKS
jgi:hypothetical protein